MQKHNSSGYVIYDGPSVIDGKPIVVIATGFKTKSQNPKTGDMIQVFILRKDISPQEAAHSGADSSVCGNCKHRGDLIKDLKNGGTRNVNRSCYVVLFMAPGNVFRSYKRGIYPFVGGFDLPELFRGRRVRLGAYGDPMAVPSLVWDGVLNDVESHTGYTHQWKDQHADDYKSYLMASVDSDTEYSQAKAKGWRTFRVRTKDAERQSTEIDCPASDEAGNRTTCSACGLCAGAATKARDILIIAHGSKAKENAFNRLESVS